MSKISVISGDIAQVKTDALITAINSDGMWFGGIDGVIQRAAGNLFHTQAAAAPLTHGKTVVARGNKSNSGSFSNVVFVVDDLTGKLRDIVYNGLKAAREAGFASVSLPTIRMGVMLGAVEKSKREAVNEMARGVYQFLTEYPNGLDITFVVYQDQETQTLLKNEFSA